MEKEKNKLGLILDDYRCPICHTLHASAFAKDHPLRRCRKCHAPLTQHPA